MTINEKILLGLRVKNAREKKEMTQEECSQLLNIDISTLGNIEKGRNFPSFATVSAIIKILDIEPNQLLDFLQYEKTESDLLDSLIFERLTRISVATKKKVLELLETL